MVVCSSVLSIFFVASVQAISEEARHEALGLYQVLKTLSLCRLGGLRTAIQVANANKGSAGATMYTTSCTDVERAEREKLLVRYCWNAIDVATHCGST